MRAPPRSATIVGIAVATMVTSTAAMNIAIMQAAVTSRLRITMSAGKGEELARLTANVQIQQLGLIGQRLFLAVHRQSGGGTRRVALPQSYKRGSQEPS
jgi:predicted ABC-type transport system involved in lysophospholipase L1 biosynthesis ATPase subunit